MESLDSKKTHNGRVRGWEPGRVRWIVVVVRVPTRPASVFLTAAHVVTAWSAVVVAHGVLAPTVLVMVVTVVAGEQTAAESEAEDDQPADYERRNLQWQR